MLDNTLPLADVNKLEGIDLDIFTLNNTNLLAIRENPDSTKDVYQFSLKDQILDKITTLDARMGRPTYFNSNNEEITPVEGTLSYKIEENTSNILSIQNEIGSKASSTGMYKSINALESDVKTLKNTKVREGYQISLIKNVTGFTNEQTFNINVISNLIDLIEQNSHSINLDLSILVENLDSSAASAIRYKNVSITTRFNLNSIYRSGDNLGVIQLPGYGAVYIKFTIGTNNIKISKVASDNNTHYSADNTSISNAVLYINKF